MDIFRIANNKENVAQSDFNITIKGILNMDGNNINGMGPINYKNVDPNFIGFSKPQQSYTSGSWYTLDNLGPLPGPVEGTLEGLDFDTGEYTINSPSKYAVGLTLVATDASQPDFVVWYVSSKYTSGFPVYPSRTYFALINDSPLNLWCTTISLPLFDLALGDSIQLHVKFSANTEIVMYGRFYKI